VHVVSEDRLLIEYDVSISIGITFSLGTLVWLDALALSLLAWMQFKATVEGGSSSSKANALVLSYAITFSGLIIATISLLQQPGLINTVFYYLLELSQSPFFSIVCN